MTSRRGLFLRLVRATSIPVAAVVFFCFEAPTASAVPAAAPIVRAIDDSNLFVPQGGNTLEEVVTLNREVPLTLLRAPLGARLQFADWPVAPGMRREVTLERHDIYAADARIVK